MEPAEWDYKDPESSFFQPLSPVVGSFLNEEYGSHRCETLPRYEAP